MRGLIKSAARVVPTPRRSWARPVAAVSLPAVLAALAILYPGAPVSQVDLNDGSVWLTNTSELRLGRFNPAVDELNAGLAAPSADFDVLQDGGDVVLAEPQRLSAVDPASVTLAAQAAVPAGATVSLAAGTVVVSDAASGNIWARPLAALGGLDVTAPGDLQLGPGAVAVAATDGVLLAATLQGDLHRAEVTDQGVVDSEVGRLEGVSGAFDQVTAVGENLVVLTGHVLHTPSASVDLGDEPGDLLLQRPGPDATSVLVASSTALLNVPLDGGHISRYATGGQGRPAAPVRVGACGHGAWASATGSYLRLCQGRGPVLTDLEGMSTTDRLVFRVNRDVVVLNDTLLGRLWMPLEDPQLRRPNWQDIDPREQPDQTDAQSQTRDSAQALQADCSAQSAAPAANDDEFGVRAGRTSILSVIDNDTSSDCGILTISEFDPLPEDFGTVVTIYGGRAFQLEVLPGASGTATFTYTISDGRGNNAPSTATVTLTVRPDAQNGPPEQVRVGTLLVEQNATATYDVLPDFRDPDGDHLILSSGVSDSGERVRTRQDGQVTFTSDGSSLGRRTVRLLVSDGTETVEGTLLVDVRPVGSLPPVIDPVQAVTYVDEPVTVHPLDSVRTSSREPVRLAGVDQLAGATVSADLVAGTFSFSAPRAGTYYVSFLVAAAPQQATGVARIDVRERPADPPRPTAVLDVALLPPGGEVTIDPLANDDDPGGGVIVLQSVEAPSDSGLQMAVLNHQLVRITSTRVLDHPTTATYAISNGVKSAVGQILVQPIPASSVQQPPVVPAVAASVRTGGVVTIPVLQGAYDPDGDPLSLVPDLVEPPGPGQGLMFVSGDVLRYQAPATPMEVHATFSVHDPSGNETAAAVTISVHASDATSKAPPRPVPLTARVFQGETIRIPVPLTSIDPDGDGVYLLGQDQAPTKGRVTAVGADYLEYEALPGEAGTDTFTYAVEDWVGQRAVATVRVGIAPRPGTSAQIVSRNDDVTVPPGTTVEVRVLANDVDTGGGELTLDPNLVLEAGVVARVEGRRIVVQTPDTAAVLQIPYTAVGSRGGRGTAVLTVTVTPDAPVSPPIARDVVVPATETINRTTVDVDVLAVAENPSGPMSDLAVSVDPSIATVARVSATGTVVVKLGETAQTLPFRITNTSPQAHGVGSYAFITVPALGDFPPIRRPGAPELRVIAGEPLRISLPEQIQVAPGRTVHLTDAAKVSATKSDGSTLVLDDQTLLYTAQRSYAGPASISFEVTDGALSDATFRQTVFSLPISVLAAEDYPPTFSPSVIDVGPGETVRVDLAAFTSAPVGTSG
ncbi:MAG TPA: Ig-like domain-containing protein, partial [Actinotalea sp.]